MYIKRIQAATIKKIAERFGGGFYGRFMNCCASICGPYSELIHRKVRTDDTAQICIDFFDKFEKRTANDEFYPLPIRWYFDMESFVTADTSSQRQQILDSVHEVCIWSANRMSWPTGPFESAYNSLTEVNCIWKYTAKTTESVPKQSIRLLLQTTINLDSIRLNVTTIPARSRKEISRIEIGPIPASQAYFFGEMPTVKWLSEHEFTVSRNKVQVDKNGHLRLPF